MPIKSLDTRVVYDTKPAKDPNAGGKAFLDAVGEMARAMFESRPEFDPELVAEQAPATDTSAEPEETISAMPKRKVDVGQKQVSKEPIYTWAFASSQPRGGTIINYITQLNQDEILSCNCPGWIFSKGDKKDKSCKHTRLVKEAKDAKGENELKSIIKKYKAGEELPILVQADGVTGPSGSHMTAAVEKRLGGKDSTIRYGRVIEL
jgi:hypothetical protein